MNVRNRPIVWAMGAALLCAALSPVFVLAKGGKKEKGPRVVQLGPRPYYLVNDMEPSPLKEKLVSCMDDRSSTTDFSIGHRGACLQFPEHTKESFEAAARMGAGIIECDVTFTSDFELVCRHAQCDLHTTTNILETPLADTCRKPFEPAEFDENGERTKEATAECCTSDITYEEFKTLCGKMDAADTNATTVEEYLGGTASWRTDLYSSCATLMSHADSIELIDSYGLKFTPELKSPQVEMPFEADDGTLYTQEDYAEKMIQEYRDAEIAPSRVWPQSFSLEDVIYWVEEAPEYGDQAVFLENRYYGDLDANDPSTWEFPEPQDVRDLGVQW